MENDRRKLAVETDHALAALHDELARLLSRKAGQFNAVHHIVGDRKSDYRKWDRTDAYVRDLAEFKVETDRDPRGQIKAVLAKLAKIDAEIEQAHERMIPLEVTYRKHGWNRYFLVTNGNGHVHRGMDCSTCFPTTQYLWLVELADCDEDAMIDEFGEKACTVCFPDLRTHPKIKAPGRRDREAIAARQAEKDARNAAKDAKRLAADEVFRTRYMSDTVETVAACKDVIRKMVDTMEELAVIKTPAFAKTWQAGPEALARLITNVTQNLDQQTLDASDAEAVLLAREARHEGWGMTRPAIDKMIASKAKAAAKEWALA